MYSIPDTQVKEGLVTSEDDCGQKTPGEKREEVLPMTKFMNGIKTRIVKHLLIIAVLMLVVHIGIAYIHSRESGRADKLLTYFLL